MDMGTLEDQLEAFRRCSMELIDLNITRWEISSPNGKTREVENVQTQEMETGQTAARLVETLLELMEPVTDLLYYKIACEIVWEHSY